MPESEKTCVLAEELGHYHTTVGNILELYDIRNIKQERAARLWAYDKIIGLDGIVDAYRARCCNSSEVANHLGVTEEFLLEALETYRQKYGCHVSFNNYVICFEPSLGVFELI